VTWGRLELIAAVQECSFVSRMPAKEHPSNRQHQRPDPVDGIGGERVMNSAGDRRWAVLAVVSVAQFLTVLDMWVANIALPTLERAFRPASLPAVSWILAVYAIVLAALLLPAGRIADSAGWRRRDGHHDRLVRGRYGEDVSGTFPPGCLLNKPLCSGP
jgi:hypothetical protein